MKRFSITYLLLLLSMAVIAQAREIASAFTDKDCYVTGERMHVRITITDEQRQPSLTSRVAYVELSDTLTLQAQGMALLSDGQGWVDIPLPTTLHSGFYMLTVYTRLMCQQGVESFHRQLVAVINPMHVTRRDDIKYHDTESKSENARSYKVGQSISVSVPSNIQTLSVVRNPITTNSFDAPSLRPMRSSFLLTTPEVEGHILLAATSSHNPASQARLASVGKGSFVVDGQQIGDSLWCFYTHGLMGNLPVILEAHNEEGNVPIHIQSPYASPLPKALPSLEVWCNEQQLLDRVKGALHEETLSLWIEDDTLKHSINFLSRRPDHFYDMDEYTRFSTVREAMVEFIQGIDRRVVKGVPLLFTPDPQTGIYNKRPALVMLDGMPVLDIDRMMAYDARLLKYVQVYNGSFTFGTTTVQGVISFISHRGLLSNFQLEEGTELVRYAFPQDHPDFLVPQTPSTSTVLWNPAVNANHTSFNAPSMPGRYQVVLQGLDQQGEPFRSTSWIEVTE